MNYNSFLTRDYKSMPAQGPKPAKRWTHLHTAVILSSVICISIVLSLTSQDAVANKTEQPEVTTNTLQKDLKLQPQKEAPAEQIVLPLEIPRYPVTEQQELDVNNLHTTTFKVTPGDSLAYLFKKHQLPAADLHQIMQLGDSTHSLRTIQPGQQFKVMLNEQQQIVELFQEINKLETLHVTRAPEGFNAQMVEAQVDVRTTFASGEINSSLFEAGKDANMNDALIMQLVGIFGWDIDFALDIRKGDRFNLLYEEHFIEGKKIKDGPIVAAEFSNQGRTYRAIRFTDNKGRTDYYSEDGRSMRKAFLRTPVDFRRISSRFGSRFHPTLNRIKLHKGVDYAAKTGTPIKAAGDGKVIFRGNKGGYGRVVILQHGGRYSTLYAHMSRFQRGVYAGKRVKQGQTIGYVGASGRATGPHLHYEFRVNGVHRNPLKIRLPDAAPIEAQYKADFIEQSHRIFAQLDARKPTRVALNN